MLLLSLRSLTLHKTFGSLHQIRNNAMAKTLLLHHGPPLFEADCSSTRACSVRWRLPDPVRYTCRVREALTTDSCMYA